MSGYGIVGLGHLGRRLATRLAGASDAPPLVAVLVRPSRVAEAAALVGADKVCTTLDSFTARRPGVAVDTYLEGYHFASLHPRTINPINHDNVMVFDAYGSHSRQGFPRRNLHELRGLPETEWDVHHHLTCVHQLFPNVAFTVSNEGILINAVYPGERYDASTTVQTHYTRTPVTDEAQRELMTWRSELVRDVVRDEDYWMTASIQAGLASGAQTHVVFGRNEQALHHYHRALLAAVP